MRLASQEELLERIRELEAQLKLFAEPHDCDKVHGKCWYLRRAQGFRFGNSECNSESVPEGGVMGVTESIRK